MYPGFALGEGVCGTSPEETLQRVDGFCPGRIKQSHCGKYKGQPVQAVSMASFAREDMFMKATLIALL